MKTPEELAEEYVAHNRSYPYNSLNAEDRYMKNSYLVGYQAAKTFYKARIKELETQLENAEMLATHGQEGL